MTPKIRVDVNRSGALLISFPIEGPQDAWDALFAKWSTPNQVRSLTREITVEPGKFVAEFDWFRNNWLNRHGQLELTEAARDLISAGTRLHAEFENLVENGPEQFSDPIVEPTERPLTSMQKENVRRLLGMANGANFSVPGSGKTITALSVFFTLMSRGSVDRLLVVCPKSAFESWQNEATLFSLTHNPTCSVFEGRPIDQQTTILLVNYEQLQNQVSIDLIKSWSRSVSMAVVLDEAHRVKGGRGKARWDACSQLVPLAKRVDLLTGTPMPQGLDDVRNLFLLSWTRLRENDLGDGVIRRLEPGKVFVRTTKAELGLPPVTTHLIEKELSPVNEQIYGALRRQLGGLFSIKPRDARDLARRGRAVMTLLAVASNPALLSAKNGARAYLDFRWPLSGYAPNDDISQLIENYASTEIPWKFQWVRGYVEQMRKSGKKVLIWTNFVGNIKALELLLSPVNPVTVFGQHSSEERAASLFRFRNDDACTALITNAQTLGEGVSLHDVCHDAVYLDRSFNASLYLQSLDRIHRLGLPPETETNISVLVSKGTIDQNVELRLTRKVTQMASLLNDASLVQSASAQPYDPDEDVLGIQELLDLDDEDIQTLFEHIRR